MRIGPSGKKFTDDWREIPDDTPIEVPVGMQRPRSMEEMVAMYVQNSLALERKMNGEAEGVEEGEDLEVEDEEGGDEILTPYELHAMAANFEAHARRKAWMEKNLRGKKSSGAVRSEEKRVPDSAEPGSLGQGEKRGDVSGTAPGGGASAVRPVEPTQGVRQGGPGGESSGAAVAKPG